MKRIISISLLSLLYLPLLAQFYNGSQMEFGKNRVQYNEPRLWQWYKFDKCNVYFYMGGKELAVYTAQQAKKYISQIEKLLDYNVDDKILFLVYNKQSDFKQSNVGLEYEDAYNIGGVTKIVGSKVSLYFDGNKAEFDKQIKAGIAEIIINQMMYGGNVREVLKNSTLLNLPDWYVKGLVSYISNNWDSDLDNRVRDAFHNNRYKRFNGLEGVDAVYAGHSIWNYICENYGDVVISNILYMTKVTRNVESAFLFVLGVSMRSMTNDWIAYYTDRYNEADKFKKLPDKSLLKKIKVSRVYQNIKISPDGKYAIYSTNQMGQYKVWLYDFSKNKAKRILKREQKLDRPTDYSYPLLAWHPSGELAALITERKGELLLSYYTLSTGRIETLKLHNFEKILDFSYSDDGKTFVMSAVRNGQSDIFIYTPATGSSEQITRDIYDDLNPRFMDNSSKIIFTSNRPADTIRFMNAYPIDIPDNMQPMKKSDVFIYDFASKVSVLRRVTNTPLMNETYPCEYSKGYLSFLSDANGIRNRYIGVLDSSIAYVDTAEHYRYFTHTYPITNYPRNILEQDINRKSQKIAEVIFYDRKYRMYVENLSSHPDSLATTLNNTNFIIREQRDLEKAKEQKKENEIKVVVVQTVPVVPKQKPVAKPDSGVVDINNYTFKHEPTTPIQTSTVVVQQEKVIPDTTSATLAKKPGFILPKQRNYFIFFSTDYVVTQLDNSFLNATYQKFTGPGPIFLSPGLTGFFKVGLSDLFDDYKITGGARVSFDLNSNEYFLSFENRLRRLDKQIVLHRQAFDYAPYLKIHTHEAKYILKWPFTETSSLRGTISGRQDRTVFFSYDDASMRKPNAFEYWGGTKLEYVFDNTRKLGLNLYAGTRLKLFAEYFRQINKAQSDLTVLGLDIRRYIRIHRSFIWANRLAASTSLGSNKLIYYMGGVDNWFTPRFNYDIPISYTENYAYQTLATPMRGFIQNIRNGNSFALINSELRLPVFRYLLNKPLKSDFFNNFQLVGFGDVGTAWTGKSPYDDNNSLNTQIINQPPITVIIQTKREPIVGGFGWGIRSRLLGYFMRLDWAHGWQDGKISKKSVFYWSLSLDF